MASSDWYLVWYSESQGVSGRLIGPATVSSYAIVQASSASAARNKVAAMKGASAVIGNVEGPYATQAQARDEASKVNSAKVKASQAGKLPNLNPFSWLSGIGGGIASGLESGFVNFLKDLWAVVIGPLEVIIGAVIAMFVLAIYFKNDLIAGAALLGMA